MNLKTALVTGASRGIGRSIALLLASRGYHVYLNCRASSPALEALHKEIITGGSSSSLAYGDVGNADDVRKIFAQIEQEHRHLDVLINNAGIAHIGLLSDMSDREWTQLLQTNLSSVFYCCRAAIPGMVARKSGKIINISSIWGVNGASCEAAYSASKAGVNGLTQALARELAPSNIQVSALACGVIDTEMNRRLDVAERRALEDAIPAGRFGTPEEVAEMVWNIITAPSYLTGQVIGFDGGF